MGIGKREKIGEINNKDVYSYLEKNESKSKEICVERIENIVKMVLQKYAKLEDENTNPGYVISHKRPSIEIYNRSVTEILTLYEIKKILKLNKANYKGYKNCRGLIGATASIAWLPVQDKTYELISYREEKLWGTERSIDSESVKMVDKLCPSTFDSYDYENKHNRLVPNSPCPILYGIRGDKVLELIKAYRLIKSEPVKNWIIFESNQATDDHLQRKNIFEIKPCQSLITEGRVLQNPYTIKGGHVLFTIVDSLEEKIDCAAYEPTKKFRNIIRELNAGDIIEVYGGIREKPLTINIEKINIKSLTKKIEKLENPICSICNKHMKSKGKNEGYKCKRCKTKSKKPVVRKKERELQLGFYEVPVCARRHLSKPLKRILQ
jgi:tRNA(Ile2)-agmatinylcytidine synthase